MAGLTACGDKVQTSQITLTTTPPAAGVVHSVTVSPASVTINVGATAQLAASVDADASVTDRTVTWTSSDATVATVDGSGKVTGVKAGTVTIVASSKASPTVQGAAAVTVSGSTTVVPTVTISSLNTTVCTPTCTSVPANLQNFGTGGGNGQTGQLDVILNVDSQGQPLKSVSATLKCGTDSLTQTQTVSGAAAPLNADASSAPVTFSFNTTQFNSTTGVAALHNGTCTISASAATAAGTQSATTSQQLTLNNADAIIGTLATSKSPVSDANGLSWVGGDVTVNVTPVFYTAGRSAVSANVVLTGVPGGTPTQTVTTFPGTATFLASKTVAQNGVAGVTVNPLGATVTIVDNTGNTFALAGNLFTNNATLGPTRLDNQAPDITGANVVVFTANTQNTSNGWVGSAFVFNKAGTIDLTATTKADNAGVDRVTDSTMYAAAGSASSAFKTFVNVSDVPESSTGTTYGLRVKVCDALGNCAVSPELTQFGVDITAPTFTLSSGAGFLSNNAIFGIGSAAAFNVGVGGVDPQSSNGATGSGVGANPVLASDLRLMPSGATSQQTTCALGTATGTAPAVTCSAPAVEPLNFAAPSTDPGQYTLTVTLVDQAGNASTPTTINYYIDNTTAPTITGGVAIPAQITVGSAFSASGTDNMDLASSDAVIQYPVATTFGGAAVKIQAIGPSLGGVAFDNTLTRSGTVAVTMASNNFYRGLASSAALGTNPKPNQIGLRALDAASNLSGEDVAALPPANIATPVAFVAGTDIGAAAAGGVCAAGSPFCVAVSPATVSNGNGTAARSTTITATVYAATNTSNTPFPQMCFYVVTPSGAENGAGNAVTHTALNDLVLIGCTGTTVTTQDANLARIFQYTMSFDPAAGYGTAGALNIVAIGSNANGDAVVTDAAAALTLQP